MGKFKITHEEVNQAYDDAVKENKLPLGGANPMQDGIDKVVQLAQAMRQKGTERPPQ